MDAEPRGDATGGSLGGDFLTFLGAAATLGLPPDRFLRADGVEFAVLTEVAHRAARHQIERDKALARAVVAELAAAMKRR